VKFYPGATPCTREGALKYFPNLLWAMAARRVRHFEVADAAAMSESQFSRAVNGRTDFSPNERTRIAKFLGYPERWLFEDIRPPRRKEAPHAARPKTAQAVRCGDGRDRISAQAEEKSHG
jgi:transcriptional regulator with XRE-family HTH domain